MQRWLQQEIEALKRQLAAQRPAAATAVAVLLAAAATLPQLVMA